MKNTLFQVLITIFLISCNRPPGDVRIVLKAAGENSTELEKVINHYKKSGNKEKLNATYFLIGNMDNKFTIDCRDINKYDPIFTIIDSMQKASLSALTYSPSLKAKWDSLVNEYGPPSLQNASVIPDYSIIKADYLIENIDIAFKLREESVWGEKISFENFCEYILPYRFSHEPLENWRSYFYNKYCKDLDSINASSSYDLAVKMNNVIPESVWYEVLMNYPYDIPASKMERILKGACSHQVIYNASAMRAIGLPVAIDFTPVWADYPRGHRWNALFSENNKSRIFKRPSDSTYTAFIWKTAKVFRETFSRQHVNFADLKEDVPEELLDDHRIDVTQEYTRVSNFNVPLRYSSVSRKRYSVICTFNNKEWVVQDWGKINKKEAYFKNIGTDVAYLAMYYDHGSLYPASDPFVLNEDGKITFLEPDLTRTQNLRLFRKYPCKIYTQVSLDNMISGSFQGANNADFSDSVNLFKITRSPEKIETALISNPSKYRYVRYRPQFKGTGDIAELQFFGGSKISDTSKLSGNVIGFSDIIPSVDFTYQKAFDGNPESFFGRVGNGSSWVGLDLGTPKRITKIKYCPRSDTNFILVGDTYELCYWYNGEWVSMGEQVAKDQVIVYDKVPSGGLYILHNLTRGKEERIFIYDNGKQIFW